MRYKIVYRNYIGIFCPGEGHDYMIDWLALVVKIEEYVVYLTQKDTLYFRQRHEVLIKIQKERRTYILAHCENEKFFEPQFVVLCMAIFSKTQEVQIGGTPPTAYIHYIHLNYFLHELQPGESVPACCTTTQPPGSNPL